MQASMVDREVMTVRILEPQISLEPLKLLMVMTRRYGYAKQHRLHGDAYCYAGCDTYCYCYADCDIDVYVDGYYDCDADATTRTEDKADVDHPGTGARLQDPRMNFRRLERLRGAFPRRQW
jgi:hypothetical protein